VAATEAWEQYASKAQPRRPVNATGASTWLNWTQFPDHGPDETVLGDMAGRRVLELGSGSGSNLAHLATLGAVCTGIDLAPARTRTATEQWGHLSRLDFVTADAVTFLAETADTFDVILSIFGAAWFTDPTALLPLIRKRMNPNAVLVFSHLPAADVAVGPDGVVKKWNYPAGQWVELLTAAGFAATADVIPPPDDQQVGTLLVRATAV
jgi:SAM-dependent methyltransferase